MNAHKTGPTRFAEVDGISFADRRFGHPIGTPIVQLAPAIQSKRP
jgi:hypothetical protein